MIPPPFPPPNVNLEVSPYRFPQTWPEAVQALKSNTEFAHRMGELVVGNMINSRNALNELVDSICKENPYGSKEEQELAGRKWLAQRF